MMVNRIKELENSLEIADKVISQLQGQVSRLGKESVGEGECQMRLRRSTYDKLWARAREKGITIGEMLEEAF